MAMEAHGIPVDANLLCKRTRGVAVDVNVDEVSSASSVKSAIANLAL